MAFPTGWGFSQKLTIQNSKVSATLTDFPALITRTELHNDIVDPSGSNNAQSDGGDIRFSSDSAGSTQLACEVIAFAYDSTTGAGDATVQIWVKVPSISSSVNTDIYVWYNTTGTDSQPAVTDTYGRNNVWDADFALVCHYEENPGGTAPQMIDSTSNGNEGTSNGSMTSADSIAGVIGNGLDFDGSNDYINHGANSSLAPTTALTLEAIVNADTLGGSNFERVVDATGDPGGISQGYRLMHQGAIGKFRFLVRTSSATSVDVQFETLSTGTNYHVFAKWDGSDLYGAVNAVGLTTGGAVTGLDYGTQADFDVGGRPVSSSSWWDGLIEEVRVSRIARSESYRTSSYNNKSSPSTFIIDSTPIAAGGATGKSNPLSGIFGGSLSGAIG